MTRSRSKPFLLFAAALATGSLTAEPAQGESIDRSSAFFGKSNPGVFATSPDESTGYAAEGSQLAILQLPTLTCPLGGTLGEEALVPLDASIEGLEADPLGELVYVAGGSFGLLKVEVGAGNSASCEPEAMGNDAGCYRVTSLDDWDHAAGQPSERWVFDVAVMEHPAGDLLLATFAELGANELRVYELASLRASLRSLRPLLTVNLPGSTRSASGFPVAGLATELAVDGTDVYVAMAEQGVVKVALADLTHPRRYKGPVLDGPGESQFGAPAVVRDVAVAGGVLLGAANGAGILEIDLAQSFRSKMSYVTWPVADPVDPSLPAYVARIDAVSPAAGEWLALVATRVSPVQRSEGAPSAVSGTVSWNLEPGGELGDFDRGDSEGFRVVSTGGLGAQGAGGTAGSARASVQLGDATGELRAYLGGKPATSVRRIGRGLPLIAERSSDDRVGKHSPRVGPSILDPNLLFTSSDVLYAGKAGYLRTCDDTISAIPGTEGDGTMGVITNYEAQWLDSASVDPETGEAASQWLVHGTFNDWRLRHVTVQDVCSGEIPQVDMWILPPPEDEWGQDGRLSFMGLVDDAFDEDVVLLSRSGSRHGLVAYSRAELQAAATDCSETLDVEPIVALDTHPEMEGWAPEAGATNQEISGFWGGQVLNFGADVARLRDDSNQWGWVALSAAGYHANDPALNPSAPDPSMHTHAMVTVHEITDLDENTDPAPLTVLYGPDFDGNAAAVQVVPIGGRTYALVADLGGAVFIYDITDLRKSGHAAPLVGSWETPQSPVDGTLELAVDLEFQRETGGGPARVYAYVSMFRGGIAVLDVSDPSAPALLRTLDTPGLVEGLHFDRAGGAPRLLAADRLGGIRVLRAE